MNSPNQPLVSVVVTVRNGERFLADAIDSVLSQTYRPIEVLIIDGQSTDRSAEIANSYDSVRYMRQSNLGIADAYNQGIESTTGSFIAFLSCDDRWLPDKLACQVEYFIEHAEVMYTVTLFRYFQQAGCTLPRTFNRSLLNCDLVGRIMETLLARAEVFDIVGRFDTSLPVAEDVDWFARAKDANLPMEIIPKVLLQKRIHDENASANPMVNTPALMRALRSSVRRQRTDSAGIGGESENGNAR